MHIKSYSKLEMWANAQRDGRPAEYRWNFQERLAMGQWTK